MLCCYFVPAVQLNFPARIFAQHNAVNITKKEQFYQAVTCYCSYVNYKGFYSFFTTFYMLFLFLYCISQQESNVLMEAFLNRVLLHIYGLKLSPF